MAPKHAPTFGQGGDPLAPENGVPDTPDAESVVQKADKHVFEAKEHFLKFSLQTKKFSVLFLQSQLSITLS